MRKDVIDAIGTAADALLEARGPLYSMTDDEMEKKLKEIERGNENGKYRCDV